MNRYRFEAVIKYKYTYDSNGTRLEGRTDREREREREGDERQMIKMSKLRIVVVNSQWQLHWQFHLCRGREVE